MRLLFSLVILGIGLGAGGGAAIWFHPSPPEEAAPATDQAPAMVIRPVVQSDYDYIRLSNQFVIPLVTNGRVTALVALSLSLEMRKGSGDQVFAREPKLRDVFLRVLFDHANSGGFEGEFTSGRTLAALRRALTESGRQVLGEGISDVLITDIARQDN